MHRFLFLPAALLALGLSACDFQAAQDAIDGFEVLIGVEAQNTTFGGPVYDAASGKPVQGVTVTLPDGVVSAFGNPVGGTRAVEGGTFNFGLPNEVVPTAETPVRLALRFEAPGYLPATRTVVLTDVGIASVSVPMLSPERPTEGVAVAQQDTPASATSGTSQETTVEANASQDSDGLASTSNVSATVAQGTVLRDAAGNAMSGTARVQVTSIAPTADAARTLPSAGAGHERVAVVNLSARVGDKDAATPSQPVALDIALPDDVQAGQQVTLRRLDPQTGAFESVETVTVPQASGKRGSGLRLLVSIFGVYDATWQNPAAARSARVTVERNGHTGPLEVFYASRSGVDAQQVPAGTTNPTLAFDAVPAGALFFSETQNGTFAFDPNPSCTSCTVSMPQKRTAEPVGIEVTPRCSDGRAFKVGSLPSFSLSARRDGQGRPVSLDGVRPVINRVGGSESAKAEVLSISVETENLERGNSYTVNGSVGNETIRESFDVPASGSASFEFETTSGTFCKAR